MKRQRIPKPVPRILILDIETAPIEAYVWRIWEENVGLDQIKHDWSILAFCAKWLGDPKLVFASTGGRGVKKVRKDFILLKKLHRLLDQADIVVTQNGKRFDIPKIRGRFLAAGLNPPSPFRQVDTREQAKKLFGLTSNKLEWLSKVMTDLPKYKHKKFPGFELWLECLKDNPVAWKEMEKYNKIDVLATEKVYLAMRPHIEQHPNVGTYINKPTCPKCGSEHQQARGWAITQAGRYQKFQCQDCGGWSRSKHSTLDTASRKALLVN